MWPKKTVATMYTSGSNTSFDDFATRWASDLEAWWQIINAYVEMTSRVIPLSAALSAEVDEIKAPLRGPAPSQAPGFTQLQKISAVESMGKKVAAIQSQLFDERLIERATRGMSHSYVDNLNSLRTKAKEAQAAYDERAKSFAGQIDATGYEQIEDPGPVTTEAYIRSLQDKPDRVERLAELRLRILGDSLALKRDYHPAQMMAYTPPPIVPTTGPHIADLRFPQAKLNITYHLDRLTRESSVLEFGPVASVTSGLTSKLVRRLKTIETDAVEKPASVSAAASRQDAAQPPVVMIEATHELLGSLRSPFGGERAGMASYSRLSGTIIMSGVDPALAEYVATATPAPVRTSDTLVGSLVALYPDVTRERLKDTLMRDGNRLVSQFLQVALFSQKKRLVHEKLAQEARMSLLVQIEGHVERLHHKLADKLSLVEYRRRVEEVVGPEFESFTPSPYLKIAAGLN